MKDRQTDSSVTRSARATSSILEAEINTKTSFHKIGLPILIGISNLFW